MHFNVQALWQKKTLHSTMIVYLANSQNSKMQYNNIDFYLQPVLG